MNTRPAKGVSGQYPLKWKRRKGNYQGFPKQQWSRIAAHSNVFNLDFEKAGLTAAAL